jgi:hypothetical protein
VGEFGEQDLIMRATNILEIELSSPVTIGEVLAEYGVINNNSKKSFVNLNVE